MNIVALKKAAPEDARTLAYIQCESWKSAFRGILSDEDLTRRTDVQKTEAMYERVLSDPAMHLTIETVDEKPHCIAVWSRSRADLGKAAAEPDLHSQSARQMAARLRLQNDGACAG